MRKVSETIIKCDCCDKEVILKHDKKVYLEEIESANFFHIHLPAQGYGSDFEDDELDFDVCGECLRKWFMQFINTPMEKIYKKYGI